MKSRLASKIVVCLFTGAAALACSYYVVNNLRQYKPAGPAAQEMRIEEAITLHSVADERSRWVRITSKMVPTCESIQESSSGSVTTTTHMALDETGKYGLFLEYEGDVGCPAAAQSPLEGLLMPASTAFWEHNGGKIPQTMLPLMRLEVGHTPRQYLENAGLIGAFGLLMLICFVVVLRVPNQDPRQQRAMGASAGTIG
jgi:hypothetical protein